MSSDMDEKKLKLLKHLTKEAEISDNPYTKSHLDLVQKYDSEKNSKDIADLYQFYRHVLDSDSFTSNNMLNEAFEDAINKDVIKPKGRRSSTEEVSATVKMRPNFVRSKSVLPPPNFLEKSEPANNNSVRFEFDHRALRACVLKQQTILRSMLRYLPEQVDSAKYAPETGHLDSDDYYRKDRVRGYENDYVRTKDRRSQPYSMSRNHYNSHRNYGKGYRGKSTYDQEIYYDYCGTS